MVVQVRHFTIIFRYIIELRTPVLEVLEEGVFQNSNPFSWLRGQIWEEVVKPKIFEELDLYWSKQARLGRTVEDILRWGDLRLVPQPTCCWKLLFKVRWGLGNPGLFRNNHFQTQENSFIEWGDETSQWKWRSRSSSGRLGAVYQEEEAK